MKETRFKQTEIGAIPEDWEVKTLGEFCSFIGGGTPDTNNQSYWNGTIPWISSSDINQGDIHTIKPSRFITAEAVLKSATKLCPANTINIVSRVGVGKIAISKKPLCTSQDFTNIITEEANIDFLAYLLQNLLENKKDEAQGTSIKGITTSEIRNILLPLPSVKSEQQRIAQALSDTDSLLDLIEKLIAKKESIKQGAMQQLLTGKMRLNGFAKSKAFKQTEIGTIPEDWEVKTLGEKVSIYRGGSPRPIQNYITSRSDGINWIKIGDVGLNEKYITHTQEKIIPEGKYNSREVHFGDFILSNSMSFGRPYILKIGGCIHDGWLTIQNYQDTFDTNYLYYLLSSKPVFNQYVSMAAGSSVQNLNKEKVAKVIVTYPSKKEQIVIATMLSDMDVEIAALHKKLDKYRALKQGMMQQLLTGKIRLNNR
jgi:type I restriction enzyme, S subunit